jgi:hypothetical protein
MSSNRIVAAHTSPNHPSLPEARANIANPPDAMTVSFMPKVSCFAASANYMRSATAALIEVKARVESFSWLRPRHST